MARAAGNTILTELLHKIPVICNFRMVRPLLTE
jgi:hypothetical protein